MNEECPFCWGQNIKKIAAAGGNGQMVDHLMFCEDCEKWYWASTGANVEDLSNLCVTIIRKPALCIEDVLFPLRSGYLSNPAQKAVEFNLLCSQCPHRQFIKTERQRPFSAGLDLPELEPTEITGGKR